jgi:2,3-bisphosphoglycerate-independent phosphoglycerate mutase
MVEDGWKTHVRGEGRRFSSAEEAVKTLREETHAIDQDLPPFVIASSGVPVGRIEDGDAVIFYNFRGDRSIEISRAFESASFDKFDRGPLPDVLYAGMLEYDGDRHIPSRYLVDPPEITNTMGEAFANLGLRQFALSETQKFGHVTYFWNGNKSGKFDEKTEEYVEIRSDTVPFEQRPWMKCAEITDRLIEALRSGKYDCLRVNFPNGDMVGHTGNLDAVITSMSALDLMLTRLVKLCEEENVTLILTADHGNADEMLEKNKKGQIQVRTAHSLNPVPFIIVDGERNVKFGEGPYGLANVAPTVADLFGIEAPECWEPSMLVR